MILVYKNLIDTETGKPFELNVPDNYSFKRKQLIQNYTIYIASLHCINSSYYLEPINTTKLCS